MGYTHSKPDDDDDLITVEPSIVIQYNNKNTHDIDGLLLFNLIINHYCKQFNINFPTDLLRLCSKIVGFVMDTDMLSETETLCLYEYLCELKMFRTQTIYSELLCRCLHDHDTRSITFDDHEDLMSTIQNLNNVLFVIKNNFNHIFIIFVDFVPAMNNLRCKTNIISTYLMRSQFKSNECPKQFYYVKDKPFSYDFDFPGKPINLGTFTIFNNSHCFMKSMKFTNCQGNEISGGPKFKASETGLHRTYVQQLEIYQIK